MLRAIFVALGLLVLGTALAGEQPAVPPVPASGQLILDQGSSWRMSALWNTPVVRKGADLKASGGGNPGFITRTAPLPAEWIQPDFADGSWSRWGLNRNQARDNPNSLYGFVEFGEPGPTLSVLCLRGKSGRRKCAESAIIAYVEFVLFMRPRVSSKHENDGIPCPGRFDILCRRCARE